MIVAGLGSQALFFGVVGLWLLALIPAATITALKGRWLFFVVGWLTLGLTWIIGAVSIAPPDSWWARKIYNEKQRARAANPLRHPRSHRTLALGIGGTLALIVVLGLFAARPYPILGVNGDALASSVGNGGLLFSTQPCRSMEDDAWECGRWDDQFSGTVGYLVTMHGLGCWTATRVGAPGEGSRKRIKGCLTITDYLGI